MSEWREADGMLLKDIRGVQARVQRMEVPGERNTLPGYRSSAYVHAGDCAACTDPLHVETLEEAQRVAEERAHQLADWLEQRSPAAGLAKELLRYRMEELSEECWYAGWLDRWEFILWDLVQRRGGRTGHGEIDAEVAAELRRLAQLGGGWWVWDDAPDAHPSGLKFLALDEWEARVAAEAGRPSAAGTDEEQAAAGSTTNR